MRDLNQESCSSLPANEAAPQLRFLLDIIIRAVLSNCEPLYPHVFPKCSLHHSHSRAHLHTAAHVETHGLSSGPAGCSMGRAGVAAAGVKIAQRTCQGRRPKAELWFHWGSVKCSPCTVQEARSQRAGRGVAVIGQRG